MECEYVNENRKGIRNGNQLLMDQSTVMDSNDYLTVYRLYFRYLLIFQVEPERVPSQNAH